MHNLIHDLVHFSVDSHGALWPSLLYLITRENDASIPQCEPFLPGFSRRTICALLITVLPGTERGKRYKGNFLHNDKQKSSQKSLYMLVLSLYIKHFSEVVP